MKNLFLLAAFAALPLFANPPAATTDTAPPASAPVTETAPAAATTASAEKKVTYKQAKSECQKEGKKKDDLKACIKEKTKH